MKNVFCMKGEQGESSYLKNSKVQFRNLQMMLRALEETLDKVVLPHHGPGRLLLTAADLGCSCGRNTLVVADAIVQHMTKLCRRRGKGEHGDDAAADPEFCFYFSDLPSNDFNTLFGLLPHRGAASSGEGAVGGGTTSPPPCLARSMTVCSRSDLSTCSPPPSACTGSLRCRKKSPTSGRRRTTRRRCSSTAARRKPARRTGGSSSPTWRASCAAAPRS
uniref:Jasmonate O-methyltransferase n=1 Tax=Oryza glaberrima TaxID=4538 RepID=I1PQN6_ORYGL